MCLYRYIYKKTRLFNCLVSYSCSFSRTRAALLRCYQGQDELTHTRGLNMKNSSQVQL